MYLAICLLFITVGTCLIGLSVFLIKKAKKRNDKEAVIISSIIMGSGSLILAAPFLGYMALLVGNSNL